MAYWWIPMAIGAGVGAVKAHQEKREAKEDRKAQKREARVSPWTGRQPDMRRIRDPNMGQEMFAGAMGGLGVGQAMGMTKDAPWNEGDPQTDPTIPQTQSTQTPGGLYEGPGDAPTAPTATGGGGRPMTQRDWMSMQGFGIADERRRQPQSPYINIV